MAHTKKTSSTDQSPDAELPDYAQLPKRVTIYDVSKAAGVAPSTVSRALSRPGRVNAQTGQRIQQIAQELGYYSDPMPNRSNPHASQILLFVVADATNPVFPHILRGFTAEASANHYTTVVLDSEEDDLKERNRLERLLEHVDGVVLSSSRMSNAGINQIAKVRPLVVVNRQISTVPSVVPDSEQGMKLLVEHLVAQGHRQITYLAGPDASWINGMRWVGLQAAARKAEIKLKRIKTASPTLECGAQAVNDWQQHPSTAVIAYNDLLATGFCKALQKIGRQVPAEVSVCGIDNSIIAQLASPTLTSLGCPLTHMGKKSASVLINLLRHRSETHARSYSVPMKLTVRESSGPALLTK